MSPAVQAILWGCAFLALIVASGFFSGIGAATIAVNRSRLRRGNQNGNGGRTQRVLALFDDAQRLLAVSLIGAAVANVAAFGALTLALCAVLRQGEHPLGWNTALLAFLMALPVVLVFGEVAPRRFFRERADRVVFWFYGPIRLSVAVLDPLARAGSWMAAKVGRPENVPALGWLAKSEQRQSLFEENGEAAAAVEEPETTERRMIHGIFDLQKTRVREVMRPLVDLVAVRVPAHCGAVRDLARSTGYSRLPVYKDRITNLTGYVDVYDILKADPPDSQPLDRYIRQAFHVPEAKRLDDLLQEMLQGHYKVAIVVDEYGGCSGWVTREDLLEEIVGEIEDEFDTGSEPIRRVDDGAILVSAALDVDDLNEELGLRLPSDEADTLGGFVYDTLGRIPRAGDAFEDDGVRFEVAEMDGRRIVTVRITLPPRNNPPSNGS